MRRTKQVAHVVVVGRVLVGVSHLKAYGTARRLAFKHAAQQLHAVGFVATCGYGALSGTAAVQLALYEVEVYVYACRHAVYHSTHCRAVAFTVCGEREYVSECVSHKLSLLIVLRCRP